MVDYKTNDWVFAIILVFEACCNILPALNTALDILPVIFMCFAVGFIDELSDRLKAIGCNSEKKSLIKNFEQSDELKELLKCIEVHQAIKSYILDIQNYFATVIMVQGVMSSIILCTTVFTMSLVSFSFTFKKLF